MNQIYITGDSFCAQRNIADQDWPALLAQQLNLELAGHAFPGCGWWPTRTPLIEHVTNHSDSTKLFVICHTDCHRPLSTHQILYRRDDSEMQSAWQTYYKHFQDKKIDYWVLDRWYQEVNEILAGYHVIHLQCFMTTNHAFNQLRGCRIATSLSERSLAYAPKHVSFFEDPRRNHFSIEENVWLAEQIIKCYSHWVSNNYPDKNYYLDQR
jgi:hypothetical protein